MITVGQLIAKLSELEPGLPVLIDGYEGGYMEPLLFKHQMVHTGPRAYMGDYDTAENARWELEDGAKPFEAVVLGRFDPT